jgi:hypothetical protein
MLSLQATDEITRAQLSALQTLYSRWFAHSLQEKADQRTARLAWATEALGRVVLSFKELTRSEAYQLINVLKVSLGQEIKNRPRRSRIRARDRAQAAGTAGRRGMNTSVVHMVSADDLARIENAITRLDWTRERFDAWLCSSTSPLGLRAKPQIRTLADANRVWWALESMLKHAGRWHPDDENKFSCSEDVSTAKASSSPIGEGQTD